MPATDEGVEETRSSELAEAMEQCNVAKIKMRRLTAAFADEDVFRAEYASNISNGGIFLATDQVFETLEPVQVEIKLGYCKKKIALLGKVVHCILPEMAHAGAEPGVAVQFTQNASELRRKFEPFVGDLGDTDEEDARLGPRGAARTRARVGAKVEHAGGGAYEALTQDLSRTGALISAGPTTPAIGERMRIALDHPTGSDEVTVEGRVVRHVVSDEGKVTALGVEFDHPGASRPELSGLLQQVRAKEHRRRLGAIRGPIDELGVDRLLQMFGGTPGQGTLTLHQDGMDGLDGSVVLNRKTFVVACAGASTGIAALAKMLSWEDGEFEFTIQIDPVFENEIGVPLEQALREARALQSPASRPGRPKPPTRSSGGFAMPPQDAKLRVDFKALDKQASGLTKTEEAVIDLAIVGMPVAKVLEVIPESREDIACAIASLRELGLVLLDS